MRPHYPRLFTRMVSVCHALIVIGAASVSLAGPIQLDTLPKAVRDQFSTLTPAAQTVAQDQLSRMGAFDAQRSVLDQTGRFFIVEDAVTQFPPHAGTVVPHVISNDTITVQPSGFTPQGVPIFHSLPGSVNVIYLNFIGGRIAGTAWNDGFRMPPFDALPYDLDGVAGFSPSEQAAITNIWRRVAEDYSPWKIDVTTEAPVPLSPRTTLIAMITKHVSAAGTPLPNPSAGGTAYLDVCGFANFYYSPALIYYDNLLSGREDVVAEAVSHELGHNFGLSHDGVINGSAYYGGAGSGAISWGAIMGAAYFRSVTKFSNGDYAGANNHEDDLAIIGDCLRLKADDVGNSPDTASPLTKTNGTLSRSGLMEWYTDADVFSIDGVTGLTLTVTPTLSTINSLGNNVDLSLDVFDAAGRKLVSASPNDSSVASLTASNLNSNARYLIRVTSVGNPVTPYSVYGGMGQYTLTGSYTLAPPPPPPPPTNVVIYTVDMNTYPIGWSVNMGGGGWSYGKPSSVIHPQGFAVIGTQITGSGLYSDSLTQNYQAISAAFSTAGFSSVSLSFDRYLGVMADDVVSIMWSDETASRLLWLNTGAVQDTAWTRVTYTLPPEALGKSKVQIRFGIGPTRPGATGAPTNSIGWNIKNIVVSGIR